jgi:hypothetical protein
VLELAGNVTVLVEQVRILGTPTVTFGGVVFCTTPTVAVEKHPFNGLVTVTV